MSINPAQLRAAAWFLIVLLAAPAAMAQTRTPAQRAAAGRPNILVILADDLADWHLGCYGNREIRTPHLDRLAAEGTRMANSFVHTPICSPSRATFFTGRTARQHGIRDWLSPNPIPDPPQGQLAPPPSFKDEVMISDLLAAAGYYCGYIGKWHMGEDERPQHGYQFWYGWTRGGSGPYRDPVMSLNGRRVEEKGYLTEVWTERAVEFITERRAQPWFLVLAQFNPHTPYEGHPQRYYDLYKDVNFASFGIEPKAPNALREANLMNDPIGNLRKAAAATTALDDQIPRLLAALEQSGQRANTLVLFTGDNGYLYGRHGGWSKGEALNPYVMYEEVIRVPLLFSMPGRLPGGRVLREFVSFYDVLPTLCEAAGVPLPHGRNLPGRSYWPLLTGKQMKWRHTAYFNLRNVDAIRDERYKLVWRNDGQGPNELFDLRTDPRERQNRIGDPRLKKIKQRLQADLQRWIERYK